MQPNMPKKDFIRKKRRVTWSNIMSHAVSNLLTSKIRVSNFKIWMKRLPCPIAAWDFFLAGVKVLPTLLLVGCYCVSGNSTIQNGFLAWFAFDLLDVPHQFLTMATAFFFLLFSSLCEFLQLLFCIESFFDRQCLEPDRQQRKKVFLFLLLLVVVSGPESVIVTVVVCVTVNVLVKCLYC